MQPLIFFVSQLTNWSVVVSCAYVMIRSMNHKFIEDFPAILTYPFGVIVCGSCGYGMLQVSAEMFDIATSFLNSWCQTRHKDFRRVLTSCSTIRIYVGSFYFVTISTTITFTKITFDYIIDCIITFPWKRGGSSILHLDKYLFISLHTKLKYLNAGTQFVYNHTYILQKISWLFLFTHSLYPSQYKIPYKKMVWIG